MADGIMEGVHIHERVHVVKQEARGDREGPALLFYNNPLKRTKQVLQVLLNLC
jgi:hypothetical protein